MSASLTDRILREIQAEMRAVRDENKLIREELGAKTSRGELLACCKRSLTALRHSRRRRSRAWIRPSPASRSG